MSRQNPRVLFQATTGAKVDFIPGQRLPGPICVEYDCNGIDNAWAEDGYPRFIAVIYALRGDQWENDTKVNFNIKEWLPAYRGKKYIVELPVLPLLDLSVLSLWVAILLPAGRYSHLLSTV